MAQTALAPGGFFSRTPALRSLGYAGFRRAIVAFLMVASGNWVERLVVGWYVHQQTNSVFLTAASFAVRSAPNVLFGTVGGAVADRFSRRRILMATAAARVCVYGGLAAITLATSGPVLAVFGLAAVSGVVAAFEVPATQAMITDLVDRRDAMNAISVNSFGTRGVGVLGAMAGGALLEVIRPGWVFLAGAGAVSIAFVVLTTMRSGGTRGMATQGTIITGALQGIRMLAGLPLVATLLIVAVLVEVLGFAFNSVLPVVADEVLSVGPAGLGALTMLTGIGGLIGLTVLSALGDFRRKGLLLAAITVGFGVSIAGLGASTAFPVSLVVVAGIGAMAAMFDALQWTVLQASVPPEMRGRAIGGWIFAIGFGWIGHLALGGVGQLIGVRWALGINGLALVVLGAVLLTFARRIRRA